MSSTAASSQKIKFINNRELLTEIHNSKKSFCYFVEPQYANFDAIVHNVKDITPEFIEAVREKKSKPRGKPAIPLSELPPESIVVRVMTYEHIPLDPNRVRKSRVTDQSYARTTFPPFKHYILLPDGPKEVLRSHWKNGFENGEFSADHGRINNRLAMMFMLLVDRYSRRSNFRGYCVDDQTEALTQRGWLKHDEINEDDIILSYQNDQLKWSKIESIYRGNYNGNMFHLTGSGIDALVTPGHKFVTADAGLRPVEYLLESDRLVLMSNAVDAPTEKKYSDDLVELIGWIVTEGNFYTHKGCKNPSLTIYQNEGPYADRIRNCLNNLGVKYHEVSRSRPHTKNINVCFGISTHFVRDVLNPLSIRRSLTPEFILALTADQRKLLIDTMVDADGWRTVQNGSMKTGYTQKCKQHTDTFLMLCTLAGIQTSTTERYSLTTKSEETNIFSVNLFGNPNRKFKRVENVDMHGGKRNGKIKGRGKINHPNEPTVHYDGVVWCPKTEFGSFIARRNGKIYLTGNTYLDEMKSQALLQLSQVGLQFDESKSDNPFAFYTQIMRNCFVRVLNLEKKSQNIRDDLLIMAGATPSYTRQIENELDYKFPQEGGETVKKRGPGAPKKTAVAKPTTVLDD
jgi:hypothetical protein